MALDTRRVCLLPVILDDGIQSRYSQWAATILSFHDKKYLIRATGRSLFIQVADEFPQAGVRYGHYSLMTALSFSHHQGMLTEVDVFKTQLEDLCFPEAGQ